MGTGGQVVLLDVKSCSPGLLSALILSSAWVLRNRLLKRSPGGGLSDVASEHLPTGSELRLCRAMLGVVSIASLATQGWPGKEGQDYPSPRLNPHRPPV